jgi:hypothetical protein
MTLAEKLAEFYHKYDTVHEGTNMERSTSLFQTLLDKNRIILCTDAAGEIIGYVESWRIDYKQLGWTICHPEYPPNFDNWDIEHGNICYVANTVIHPDYRFKYVYQYLKTEFFRQNFACEFFCGQAYRKRHQPLKVFTRQQFYDKYSKVESKEGVVSRG